MTLCVGVRTSNGASGPRIDTRSGRARKQGARAPAGHRAKLYPYPTTHTPGSHTLRAARTVRMNSPPPPSPPHTHSSSPLAHTARRRASRVALAPLRPRPSCTPPRCWRGGTRAPSVREIAPQRGPAGASPPPFLFQPLFLSRPLFERGIAARHATQRVRRRIFPGHARLFLFFPLPASSPVSNGPAVPNVSVGVPVPFPRARRGRAKSRREGGWGRVGWVGVGGVGAEGCTPRGRPCPHRTDAGRLPGPLAGARARAGPGLDGQGRGEERACARARAWAGGAAPPWS